jgi:hypothetical protein
VPASARSARSDDGVAVKQVPDEFLLTSAAIAATLIGLLLLGGFFYLETGFRRASTIAAVGGPFLRATTRLTLLLYAMVLGISLGLVVLRRPWLTALYLVLGVAILAALVEWTRCYRALRRVLPIPRASPWITWSAIAVTLAWPWAVDGWSPDREPMTTAVLFAGALALMSTADLLLRSFDLAGWERTARDPPAPDEMSGEPPDPSS